MFDLKLELRIGIGGEAPKLSAYTGFQTPKVETKAKQNLCMCILGIFILMREEGRSHRRSLESRF